MEIGFRTCIRGEGNRDYLDPSLDLDANFTAMSIDRLENFNASGYRIGLVKVRNGEIICGNDYDFSPIKLTKKIQKELGKEKVDNLMSLPSFDRIWPEIEHYFDIHFGVVYRFGEETGILSYLLNSYDIQISFIDFAYAQSKTLKKWESYLEEIGEECGKDECYKKALIVAEAWMNGENSDQLKYLRKRLSYKL